MIIKSKGDAGDHGMALSQSFLTIEVRDRCGKTIKKAHKFRNYDAEGHPLWLGTLLTTHIATDAGLRARTLTSVSSANIRRITSKRVFCTSDQAKTEVSSVPDLPKRAVTFGSLFCRRMTVSTQWERKG